MSRTNIAVREAEKTVIAAILANRLSPVEADLSGAEFSDPEYTDIFLAAKQMQTDGAAQVDVIALSNFLNVNYKTPEATPASPKVLLQLASSNSELSHSASLKLLKQNALRNELQKIFTASAAAANDPHDSLKEVLDYAETQLAAVRRNLGFDEQNIRHISEITESLSAQYTNLRDGVAYAFPTGFDVIDNATNGGIGFGNVWVIGGFSGGGKSALALNMAYSQSRLGIASLIFSREMINEDIVKRLHTRVSGVPMWMIRKDMFDSTHETLQSTLPALNNHKLYFDDRTSDILGICRAVRDAVSRFQIQVVYIDYAQLIKAAKGAVKTRAQEISDMMRDLNELALELRIGLVVLAQYNRTAAYAGKAKNESFADSSEIEKTATVVLHLSLEQVELVPNVPMPTWRKAEIEFGKGRNSGQALIGMWYRGETFTFTEIDPELSTSHAEQMGRFDQPFDGEVSF